MSDKIPVNEEVVATDAFESEAAEAASGKGTTMTTATTTRTLPETGTWAIDGSHSSVEFVVRHLVVARVRGRFDEFEGAITVGERPEDSAVEVAIRAGSVDTRDPQRDEHLRSPDFLDVDRYPTLAYRSTAVRPLGGERFTVEGELTVHGVTRAVPLDLTYRGTARDPWGNTKAVFSAITEVDREDFGLTWNQALETGGVLVGRKITVEIEVEAVLTRS
jgi:polyisoprenoid-binding protein YceI